MAFMHAELGSGFMLEKNADLSIFLCINFWLLTLKLHNTNINTTDRYTVCQHNITAI